MTYEGTPLTPDKTPAGVGMQAELDDVDDDDDFKIQIDLTVL